jgi:hypothetical protein
MQGRVLEQEEQEVAGSYQQQWEVHLPGLICAGVSWEFVHP